MSRPGGRRSGWFPLTAGCGLVVLVALAAFSGLGVFGIHAMRTVRAELRDPDRRHP